MNIQDKADTLLSFGMDGFKAANTKKVTVPCPYCSSPVTFPVVVRAEDLELFRKVLAVAYQVMDKYDIQGHLIADIKTACYIAMAKERSKE